MYDSYWQPPRAQSKLPVESEVPGSSISAYRNTNGKPDEVHSPDLTIYQQDTPVNRVRSHTVQETLSPVGARVHQEQLLHAVGEQNRSRSSSWPHKPPTLESPQVHRTRSSGKSSPRNRKNSDPPTPRKKRKRLNPQRRSFYKALHNDFPLIAEALREARQGNCALTSLRSRNIFFSRIEARPPQDPTNLNVRRYNDMVFIWDPNIESWLQVPGNGRKPECGMLNSSLPPNFGGGVPNATADSQSFLPSFQLNPSVSPFTDASYTYTGPFVSDSSQSENEDEDYSHEELSQNLNAFLPMNLINDVL